MCVRPEDSLKKRCDIKNTEDEMMKRKNWSQESKKSLWGVEKKKMWTHVWSLNLWKRQTTDQQRAWMSLQLSFNGPYPAAATRKITAVPSLTCQNIWFGNFMTIQRLILPLRSSDTMDMWLPLWLWVRLKNSLQFTDSLWEVWRHMVS